MSFSWERSVFFACRGALVPAEKKPPPGKGGGFRLSLRAGLDQNFFVKFRKNVRPK